MGVAFGTGGFAFNRIEYMLGDGGLCGSALLNDCVSHYLFLTAQISYFSTPVLRISSTQLLPPIYPSRGKWMQLLVYDDWETISD